jgi:hypothetical protein
LLLQLQKQCRLHSAATGSAVRCCAGCGNQRWRQGRLDYGDGAGVSQDLWKRKGVGSSSTAAQIIECSGQFGRCAETQNAALCVYRKMKPTAQDYLANKSKKSQQDKLK